MPIFCLKKLESLTRVGERLKKEREKQGLSLDDICQKSRIPLKYLEAIELGHFKELPQTKAHRLAYIREYAEDLNLNPASLLYQFSQESDLTDDIPSHPRRALAFGSLSSLTNIFKNIGAVILLAGFIGYLAWQVNGVLQLPKLIVYTPTDGYISSKPTTLVQGETEKEVRLTVNGKDVMANDDGKFEIPLDLSNGVNTITISAIKKHGKVTTITRNIIVKSSALTAEGLKTNFNN
ncbi:MAG TPA: helix-turn-helix domain-containing protein [Candidatus Udaeobacter sp.]|nr:helix-turn-helix domain-containing protein [Candidatus Udaeobacter sp.]